MYFKISPVTLYYIGLNTPLKKSKLIKGKIKI